MKLINLIESKDALEKLFAQDLPVKTAYKLSKIIKAINLELTLFDEFKNKLLYKYGENQGGDKFNINGDNIALFQEEIKTLLESEVNIEVPTITVEELGDIKLSSKDLLTLEYLIVEE